MNPNTLTFWTADEGLTLAADYARQGLTNAEIAARMGVSPRTLKAWRGKSPALDAAIHHGRDWASAAVEGALLRRALGYTAEELTIEDSPSGEKRKVCEKHVPGDLSAQLVWLKTHRADTWGEKTATPRNGMLGEIIEAVKSIE